MSQLKQEKQSRFRNSALLATVAFLLLTGIIGTGCSDQGKAPGTAPAPAQKSAQQPQSQATITQPTTTVSAEQKEQEYAYDARGRRDPFQPLMIKKETAKRQGPRPPLERYETYEYKLSGIVWGGFGYNAMVEGPDGKGYFVHVGTVMGLNKGVVKKITENKLIVEEKFKNFSGGIERKEIVLELRKSQEGMP